MWDRILEILRKEFIQMLRDPRMRLILFLPPIIELIIFGYAVNLEVEKSRIAWLDRDNSVESRELLSSFQGSSYFDVAEIPETAEQVTSLLDSNSVVAAILILPGFGRDLHGKQSASVQIIVNGINSNTAAIVSNYASEIVATHGAKRSGSGTDIRTLYANEGHVSFMLPNLSVENRVWFNPDLKSRDFFIPGVVVNIIAYVTLMLTAMSIVRERELGTIEQLNVTPIRPIELIIGKLLPYAVIGILDVIVITAAALIVFRTPFKGSILLLLSSTLFFLLATLGAGLFISTVSRTQQQALMGSFVYLLPALLLSGFAFPIRNMPLPVQLLTYVNPLRYFIEIVRGVFLKGSGISYLWPQMTTLAIIGILTLLLSAARFQKRLD